MPLTLLSVPRETGRAWARALAEKRTPGENLAAELWAEHLGETIACFLCDAEISTPPPPFTQLLPDKRPDNVVCAPLCPSCAALPPMIRSHRCMRLWRKVIGAPHW